MHWQAKEPRCHAGNLAGDGSGTLSRSVTFMMMSACMRSIPCVNVSIMGLFAMQGVSLVVPVAFLGPSLIFMMMYVWSRNFPSGNVSIMGMVNLQAFYLPFAMLALSLIMGGDWVSELLGILAGHL